MKDPNGTVNASALGASTIDEVVALRLEHGRAYVHQDANWNVIALTDLKGATLERYYCSPYGQLEVSGHTYFGDYDGDAFVDGDDADDLCTTGCACTFTASAAGDCRVFDFDCDGDLDETDQDTLRSLYQGLSSDMQNRRVPSINSSPLASAFAYQGLVLDPEVKGNQMRNRWLAMSVHRFGQRDPFAVFVGLNPIPRPITVNENRRRYRHFQIPPNQRIVSELATRYPSASVHAMWTPFYAQYRDGLNLYEFVQSRPMTSQDPFGTAASIWCSCSAPTCPPVGTCTAARRGRQWMGYGVAGCGFCCYWTRACEIGPYQCSQLSTGVFWWVPQGTGSAHWRYSPGSVCQ